MNSNTFEYDITLSFAGENREFVREVASELKKNRIKVFYDEYEQINLWGKDLYTHLDEIYSKKARYCVMFISKYYKQKLWTNHERESAQARAFKENSEYILPFRFDDTEIPGVRGTVGYLSSDNVTPIQLAAAIIKKVGYENNEDHNTPENDIIEGENEPKSIEHGIFAGKDGTYEIKINKSEFFSSRLAKAFPGVRGLEWFENPKTILDRVGILLKSPRIFDIFPGKKEMEENGIIGGWASPIWWFRGGGSLAIKDFRKLSDTKCLIEWDEYEIERIAVYRDPSHYRSFIYVEVKAEKPAELANENVEESIKFQLEYKPYASQSYAIYKDKYISIEEYDDGAAIIDGVIVNLNGEGELRRRFLTKYNFIICAQSAVYNSNHSDKIFGEWMDKRLKDDSLSLADFLPRLLELPPDPFYRIDFYK